MCMRLAQQMHRPADEIMHMPLLEVIMYAQEL